MLVQAASKAFLAEFASDSVPLVPGYSGEDQSLATLLSAGKEIRAILPALQVACADREGDKS